MTANKILTGYVQLVSGAVLSPIGEMNRTSYTRLTKLLDSQFRRNTVEFLSAPTIGPPGLLGAKVG